MKAAFFLGRILYGGMFVQSGIHHLKHHETLAPYADSKGIPNADQAVIASGILLTLGGASIILGVKPKLGVASLIGFLAIASGTMHDFWNLQDPGEKQSNFINFSKNMALLGAGLALAGVREPWPVSFGKD